MILDNVLLFLIQDDVITNITIVCKNNYKCGTAVEEKKTYILSSDSYKALAAQAVEQLLCKSRFFKAKRMQIC